MWSTWLHADDDRIERALQLLGMPNDSLPGSATIYDWWVQLHTVTVEESAGIAKVLGTWLDRRMDRAPKVGRTIHVVVGRVVL